MILSNYLSAVTRNQPLAASIASNAAFTRGLILVLRPRSTMFVSKDYPPGLDRTTPRTRRTPREVLPARYELALSLCTQSAFLSDAGRVGRHSGNGTAGGINALVTTFDTTWRLRGAAALSRVLDGVVPREGVEPTTN